MNSTLDVMALSEEVERDSQSGKLSKDLLAQGNTLYGVNPVPPELIEKMTPDDHRSLGRLSNGKFEAVSSLLRLDC